VALTGDLHLDPAVLAGDHRVGDLLGLGAHLAEQPAHEALDGVDGVAGVHRGLAPGQRADEALPAAGEGDDGGGGATALGIGDDGGLAALHHGHHAVGGTEIDADGLGHVRGPSRVLEGEPVRPGERRIRRLRGGQLPMYLGVRPC